MKKKQTKKQPQTQKKYPDKQQIHDYQNQFENNSSISQNISKNNENLPLVKNVNNQKELYQKQGIEQSSMISQNNLTYKEKNQEKTPKLNQSNLKTLQLTQQQKRLLTSLTISQLLQQRSKLIQQLQKININLSQLINQRQRSYNQLESLKKETHMNKNTYKQITEECRDYQFMLSGDYSLKLSQEIQHEKTYLRQLRKQVWHLNKQMQLPIQVIIKQNQDKQKELYDLELFVIEQKSLLQQKKLKLQQIQRQTDLKKEKTGKLNYRQKQLKKLIQMYFDQDYQTIMTKNPKNAQENLQKLKVKKQKLSKVILSQQSNNLKNYNKKLAQTRQIDKFLLQLQEVINQCSLKIIESKQERQTQKIKHNNILQRKKQKQTRQTLSGEHYQNSKLNPQRKLFSLPKFVEKRVVGRYPDNNPYSRKKIYTQLQNSNYFKNQNKQNEFNNNNYQQKQTNNERIKTDSGYGINFKNLYKMEPKKNQDQLETQKLQILKSLLNQELVQKHKKIKDKKISFIAQRNKPILNSMSTQVYQQQQKEAQANHYRQLCLQLGKQKLLIEQDEDIRQLIYEGIGGRV